MSTVASQSLWVDRFPGLSRLEDATKTRLMSQSRILKFSAQTVIFGPDKSPENMLFLLKGTVRVQQGSDTGREIVLYRINAGESCVLTTACLLAYDDYAAEGIVETPVQAAAIPRNVFDDLVATSKSFRTFVFAAFSKRITDLFQMVDAVAFQRIDVRLAQRLLSLANGAPTVSTTHQKLSVELGTAREVVSRHLQEFQRRGWIAQSRGTVQILDQDPLQRLSEKSDL